MAHRMILKYELAGERSIAIERHGRGAIQIFIAKSTYCRGRRSTVVCQQGERGFLRNAVILFRVVAVHRVDGVPGHAGDWLAGSQQLREVDLDRVHAGNVITTTPIFRPSLGRRVCHSVSESVAANPASAVAPASRRAARASDRLFIVAPSMKVPQRETVTRKNVAGMEVPFVLLFCAFASSKSWLWRSSTFPLFSAASKAFIIVP